MKETFIKEFKVEDLKICDDLITYFKENNQYKQSGKTSDRNNFDSNSDNAVQIFKKSTDVYVFNESQDPTIIKYFQTLSGFIKQYLDYYKLKYFVRTKEATNIQYYKPGEGYYGWHCERTSNENLNTTRAFVFMTYLNNVKNGGTEFKYQNKKFQAKKGSTLIWPSDFTHTHRGVISKTQEKYIITGWFHFSSKADLETLS